MSAKIINNAMQLYDSLFQAYRQGTDHRMEFAVGVQAIVDAAIEQARADLPPNVIAAIALQADDIRPDVRAMLVRIRDHADFKK